MKKQLLSLLLAFASTMAFSQTYYGMYENSLPTSSSNARLNELNTQLGKKPGVWMRFMSVGTDLDVTGCNALIAQGITPVITLEPFNDATAGKNYGKYDNVIAGYYDDYWRKFADQVKLVNGTIFLRYAHEMNGNWYDWDGYHNQNNADAPAKYILAWKHIYNIIKTQKQTTNILWTWCVNGGSWPNVDWNQDMQYYPGSDYVDWLSFDAYDKPWNYTPTKYQTVEQLFGTIYNTLTTAVPDKPILIAEFASENLGHETDPHKAEFFSQGSTLFEKFPRIHAFSYFNIAKYNSGRYNNYKIDNPSTLVPIFKANWIDNKNVISGNAGIETIHQYKVVPTTGTLKIEAENYFDQYGIITESCTEGGFDAGSASTGDYMDYLINVSASGSYTCNLRVASAGTTGKIEIRNQSGTVLNSYAQTVSTGGWQKYEDHAITINLTAGKQKLRVYYAGGGINLNWFELSKVTTVNTAPTNTFSSPANNSVYTEGDVVKITNIAADADLGDAIAKIEYFDNDATTAFHTEGLAPYDFNWSTFSVGTHIITAKAYDTKGATKTATVTITVNVLNTAPTNTFSSPANNSVYTEGDVVKITNIAADADLGDAIAKIDYFDNGATTAFHTEGLAPYDFNWSTFSVGTHIITAKAYDTKGALTTATVTITVNNPYDPFTASYFHLIDVLTQDYMRPTGGSTSATITQYEEATTPTYDSYQWEFRSATGGYYYIINKLTQKAIQPTGASTAENTGLSQVAFTSQANDEVLWSLIPSGDGNYWIKNKKSGLYIRPYGGTNGGQGNVAIVQNTLVTTYSSFKWNIKTLDAKPNVRIASDFEEFVSDNFSFYPNPATDVIHLSQETNWELVDITGISILSGFGNSINTANITNGMYIIKVKGNSHKVVIQ